MCGIAGVIDFKGVRIPQLVGMNDSISHRGPDDEGYLTWDNQRVRVYTGTASKFDASGDYGLTYLQFNGAIENLHPSTPVKVAFAHRRLAIVDLSINGHQPMSYSNSRIWITYNGEIYNFKEVRAELQQAGLVFNTETDTEVILAAYLHWGEKCLDKFRGMWAFAILDVVERTIFFSRDRFGIKPLYYRFDNASLVFGSEIKAILTYLSGEVKPAINNAALLNYLNHGITDYSSETFFQGIFQVLPGHNIKLSFDDERITKFEVIKWYDFAKRATNGKSYELPEAVEKFKSIFFFQACWNMEPVR